MPAALPSAPRSPSVHLFGGTHVLLPNGNRIYELDGGDFGAIAAAVDAGDEAAVASMLTAIGLDAPPFVDDRGLEEPPLRALSLAIAQKCNLGCTYCYAQQGEFGGPAKNMERTEAFRAVDLLVAAADRGARLNLAFLGGEPLVNRKVLRAATERAAQLAT